jgi:hypothetical protein
MDKTTLTKEVPINIWDDYYDDGHVPIGEKQETYIYVEDHSLDIEYTKKCLEMILDYILKNVKWKGVKFWMDLYDSENVYPNSPYPEYHFKRWQINAENLTHELRESLLDVLEAQGFNVDGVPLNIYSES